MEEFDLWKGLPKGSLGDLTYSDVNDCDSVELNVDDREDVVDVPKLCVPNAVRDVLQRKSTAVVDNKDGSLSIYSVEDLSKYEAFKSLVHKAHEETDCGWRTLVFLNPNTSVVLRSLLPRDVVISKSLKAKLRDSVKKSKRARAYLTPDGKHIHLDFPNLRFYRELANKLNGYPVKDGGYRILIDKALDLESLSSCILSDTDRSFPSVVIDESVFQLNREPIPGFNGDVNDLKNIPTSVLNVVSSSVQSWKQRAASSKSMVKKLSDLGIDNLYQLMFWLPRRYIDKSDPQDISDLVIGESSTITGFIRKSTLLPNDKGVRFTVEVGDRGRTIDVIFWRQNWLKNKFKEDMEVIITGKLSFFRGTMNLNGASIDHAEEVALLPIVPVYNQSASKGVSTKFILSAIREMISRLGDFPLPEYLQAPDRDSYSETLRELHFPSSLENCRKAIDNMAYYELVLMQVQLITSRKSEEGKEGIAQLGQKHNYQKLAVDSFEWALTSSQKHAVSAINRSLASSNPTRILLNSDVGTGKTVVAQLAALRCVDSGRQAIIASPTEVLARQLYATFDKLIGNIKSDKKPEYRLLVGGMTVKEKNLIKQEVKDGIVDVLIGTHSILSPSMTYNDLGMIIIDEQQKFGAEQRSNILNMRSDDKKPDLLMQSATPIPRSTAQVLYGDMEMIALKGKPEGRKPIETVWIQEDPKAIVSNYLHDMWIDLSEEVSRGNQVFIVTPMVNESEKIDAASVEDTYNYMKTIFGANVAMVHGKMKTDEQHRIVEDFRNKVFNVLVASSVVEVGVDIPDATRVVILSAGRFGASSLHQIRGRVGRSEKDSKCYLIDLGKTKSSEVRMNAMVEYNDGYEIAKIDLKLRGEGMIFNTSQSGASELVFASLNLHAEKIPDAQKEAERILNSEYADLALCDSRNRFELEDSKRLV